MAGPQAAYRRGYESARANQPITSNGIGFGSALSSHCSDHKIGAAAAVQNFKQKSR
jgi:hypothetical protein